MDRLQQPCIYCSQGTLYFDQKSYLSAKEKQQKIREALLQTEQGREHAQEKRKQLREQLIGMEAQRRGISALQNKDSAEQTLANGKQKLQQLSIPLLEQQQILQASLRATELLHTNLTTTSISADIPSLGQKKLLDTAKSVMKIKDEDAIDLRKLLGKDWIDLSPLEQHLSVASKQQSLINQW